MLVALSCLTFCDPTDCSPRGSSVHGIFQAKILEWVAMPSSRGSSRFRNQTHVSYVSCIGGRFFTTSTTWETQSVVFQLFAAAWTVAYQASLSMGFSRQKYQSGLPFTSPGDLPDPGIEPRSPTLQADALTSEPPCCIHCGRGQCSGAYVLGGKAPWGHLGGTTRSNQHRWLPYLFTSLRYN